MAPIALKDIGQAASAMLYADVVFHRPFKRPFTYAIPKSLDWEVCVGGLV